MAQVVTVLVLGLAVAVLARGERSLVALIVGVAVFILGLMGVRSLH